MFAQHAQGQRQRLRWRALLTLPLVAPPRGSSPELKAHALRMLTSDVERRIETHQMDRYAGMKALAADGVETVVVAHADLPRATRLDHCAGFDGITLVPDRHHDGTPVAVVPTGTGFRFAYGPGSFAAHVAEAERLGLAWRSLLDPDLAWDVDGPDDLAALES